jgi:PIN domain nuclease of toxin-antitoxin system
MMGLFSTLDPFAGIRLQSSWPGANGFRGSLKAEGIFEVSVTIAHACHAGHLRGEHQDPFDRMLMAQAQLEGLVLISLVLISTDEVFDRFGIQRIW